MSKRVLLLVIDGLGIGALPDVSVARQNDIGANTLLSLFDPMDQYKFFDKVGLFDLAQHRKVISCFSSTNHIGRIICRSKLGYKGADSFIGHSTILGINNKIEFVNLSDYTNILVELFSHTYNVEINTGYIKLNDSIYISNNMESDPGYSINIIIDNNCTEEPEHLQLANIIKMHIPISRILIIYGKPLDKNIIDKSIVAREDHMGRSYIGICIPCLNIYNENYKVKHFGRNNYGKNILQTIIDFGYQLSLIGKTSTMFDINNSYKFNHNDTDIITKKIYERWEIQDDGLIFANFQGVDLGGHENNPQKCLDCLHKIDDFLDDFLKIVKDEDLIIITADHGNDPCIGHSFHTREFVPIILISKSIHNHELDDRNTLQDIGATICEYLHLDNITSGKPIELL